MKRTAVLAAASAVLVSGCGYNRIQTLDEEVTQYQSQIEVALQRRNDLIPNLVSTVRGFAEQEMEIFDRLATARARPASAQCSKAPEPERTGSTHLFE